jgi:hypothetical protein
METLFEYSIYVGLLLVVIAVLWLIILAFQRSWAWGAGVIAFAPVLLPWHIIRSRPKTVVPSALLALGLALLAFPPLYTRLVPIDLGPRVTDVEGGKHITLTGWDRKEYRGLAQHPDAIVLQMANPDVDDATLEYLAGMTRLRELDLDGTQITDAGLRVVGTLPELQRLRISRTRVTDGGFRESLASHPKLRQLWCPETGIRKDTLESWKQSGVGRRYIGGIE